MKSTQAMRDRIRELVGRERDDYDRAVECILDDLEDILTSAQTASVPPSPSYPGSETLSDRLRGEAFDAVDWNGKTMKYWDEIRANCETLKGSDLPRLMFESLVEGFAELMTDAANEIDGLRERIARLSGVAQTASVPPSPSYPDTEDGPNTPDEALDLLMHEAGWTDMHGDDHHEDDCPICRSIAIVRAGLNHAYQPSAGVAQAAWECGARRQGTPGGNDPVDPRCTCAAIVNPNIPHARSCPLSSTESN